MPARGNYTVDADGGVTIVLFADSVVYSGRVVGTALEGKVTQAGKSKGKFSASR